MTCETVLVTNFFFPIKKTIFIYYKVDTVTDKNIPGSSCKGNNNDSGSTSSKIIPSKMRSTQKKKIKKSQTISTSLFGTAQGTKIKVYESTPVPFTNAKFASSRENDIRRIFTSQTKRNSRTLADTGSFSKSSSTGLDSLTCNDRTLINTDSCEMCERLKREHKLFIEEYLEQSGPFFMKQMSCHLTPKLADDVFLDETPFDLTHLIGGCFQLFDMACIERFPFNGIPISVTVKNDCICKPHYREIVAYYTDSQQRRKTINCGAAIGCLCRMHFHMLGPPYTAVNWQKENQALQQLKKEYEGKVSKFTCTTCVAQERQFFGSFHIDRKPIFWKSPFSPKIRSKRNVLRNIDNSDEQNTNSSNEPILNGVQENSNHPLNTAGIKAAFNAVIFIGLLLLLIFLIYFKKKRNS